MRYLVVSDAHLGLGDIKRDEVILAKLVEMSSEFDKIVFNGDMIESWKYKKMKWTVTTRASKVQKLFDRLPALKTFMDSDKCEVLIGNHDISLEKFGYLNRELVIDTAQGKFLVIHGNDCDRTTSYDYIKSSQSWWVVLGSWLSSKLTEALSRIGVGDVDDIETEWDNVLFTFQGGSDTMRKYAEKLFNTRSISGLVTGHTHDQEVITFGRKVYVNSGYCSDTEIQAAVIDTEAGTINPIIVKY